MDRSEIERFCAPFFGEKKGSLGSIEKLSGGAVNKTLKIRWGGVPYILRCYVRNPFLADLERDLYRYIESSIPVPKLLYTKGPIALFQFIDKERLDGVQVDLSYALGEMLAKIHGIRFDQAGLFGSKLEIARPFEEGSSPYLEYLLENLDESALAWKRLGQIRAKRLLDFVEKNQDFFPSMEKGGVLVHSDFKPVNILWDARGGLTILDWEFAHAGHPLMDFAILLRHQGRIPLDLNELARGYQEHGGTLPEGWEHRARITDLTNLVDFLNRPEEKPDFPEIIQTIDKIVKNETEY